MRRRRWSVPGRCGLRISYDAHRFTDFAPGGYVGWELPPPAAAQFAPPISTKVESTPAAHLPQGAAAVRRSLPGHCRANALVFDGSDMTGDAFGRGNARSSARSSGRGRWSASAPGARRARRWLLPRAFGARSSACSPQDRQGDGPAWTSRDAGPLSRPRRRFRTRASCSITPPSRRSPMAGARNGRITSQHSLPAATSGARSRAGHGSGLERLGCRAAVPFVEHAAKYFGEDRLIFGSDWPVCLLAGSYGEIKSALETCLAKLGPQARDKAFGVNAKAAYRLAIV